MAPMIAAALLLAPAMQDTFDLRWKPKQGAVLQYAVSVNMDVEGQGLKFQTRLKLGVKQVLPNGDYVLETSTSRSAMEIAGKAVLTEDGPARLERFNANGERLAEEPDEDPIGRVLSAVSDFAGPTKPVPVGGQWTRRVPSTPRGPIGSTSLYELTSAEKNELNVSYDYREDSGDPRVNANGTFVISRTDFSVRSYRATIRNVRVDAETPPATIVVVMTRV